VLQARVAIVEGDATIQGLVNLHFGTCEAEAPRLLRNLKAAAFPLHDVVVADDPFVYEAADAFETFWRWTPRSLPFARLSGEAAVVVGAVKLEVRDEAAAKAAVQLAVDTFRRLDVLVNNAGYGQFAPFEQMSAEDFQAIMDTCFYGVVYTTRAAVPVMRKQKSGHIFQVSSVGGRHAVPGNTPYHAAKWAVGGFSDSLAIEVAPFGVKVCTLEPGGIRTNWARRAVQNAPDLLPEY
jgi:NAD(P)-dependent dehydrogenase (short-subunit alcohol dehydrogenase family)